MKKTVLVLLIIVSFGMRAQQSELTISPRAKNEKLNMPWRNCIAVGRAHNLLRADILDHLAYAQNIMGYKYCRFHAIFDDQMEVVKRDIQTNKLIFNWHQVDKVYDAILKLGIRPFVELNPMPRELASGSQTMFNYEMNVTPPKSYDEWGYLVESFTKHLVERYGIDEVQKWYFEVWNEPNLGAFWSGTQAEYWKLYTASAKAIKSVDPSLRVGGPASSKANWIKDIITYTTQNKIPLDFISTHLYSQDEQIDYPDRVGSPYKVGDYFSSRIKDVTKWVSESERPDLEIHWTEWNTLASSSAANITWGENIYVDNLFAATFIARNCIELDGYAKTLAYWVISDIFDEGSIPHSPFSCTYGLITIHGLPKASFNAFRFLRKMDGYVMDIKSKDPLPNGKGGVATITQGLTKILLWNQNFVEEPKHTDWKGVIDIPVAADTVWSVVTGSIGSGAGSAWETWQQMGTPLNLTQAQFDLLKFTSEPQYSYKSANTKNGKLRLEFDLLPGELKIIEVSAKSQAVTIRFANPEEFKVWDKGMGEKSK